MSERYNFVTENIDDFKKASALVGELGEFCNNVMVHEFKRIGISLEDGKAVDTSTRSYFITGQSVEVDSNAGCYELRSHLEEAKIAAVFINCPTETGTIYCGCKNYGVS